MAFGPEIHTVKTARRPDVTLAPIEPEDLKDLPVVGADSPTLTYVRPVTAQHMRALAEEGADAAYYTRMRDRPNRICWGVYCTENDRQKLVGITGIMGLAIHRGLRVGDDFTYILNPDYMGRGVTTQVQPAQSWWLMAGEPRLDVHVGHVIPANQASMRSLERVGYHRLGPTPDSKGDTSHDELQQFAPRLGEKAIRLAQLRADELGLIKPNSTAIYTSQNRTAAALQMYDDQVPLPSIGHYEFPVAQQQMYAVLTPDECS